MVFAARLVALLLVLISAVKSYALDTGVGDQDYRALQLQRSNGVSIVADDGRKWYSRIQSTFKGINLQRCSKRLNAPKEGASCSKTAKTCFFGNQACPGLDSHPATKCYCNGDGIKRGNWSCAIEECPQEIGIAVDHCGCDACTCCCVSQSCSCCNKCDQAVVSAHETFLKTVAVTPVGTVESPPQEIVVAVDHCGCDACTCCCVSQSCSCCNKCDQAVVSSHEAFLKTVAVTPVGTLEPPPQDIVVANDHCGCDACTCCCVSQSCSCCNKCDQAVVSSHEAFLKAVAVTPVGTVESPPQEVVVAVDHCGCDACTCCCVSQSCSCCNKCDQAVVSVHDAFLVAMKAATDAAVTDSTPVN